MIALLMGLSWAAEPAEPAAGEDEIVRLQAAVSRSRGRVGGVSILWPRVIPAVADPEVRAAAVALQARLEKIAERAAPVAPRDVRPEPERVCPRDRGCRSASIGVLLGHRNGGCVAVALVGRPGRSPTEIVPLAGGVEMLATNLPFRAPPESVVTVTEFVPCSRIADAVVDSAAVLALRRALEASE